MNANEDQVFGVRRSAKITFNTMWWALLITWGFHHY